MTVDAMEDGSRRAGGSALYSALQAARLGCRALIVTRGRPAEIERLLEPWAGELEVMIQPAPRTTTLVTWGRGSRRRQRVAAWAGPIDATRAPASAILHMAPVARELGGHIPAVGPFCGLTPQGLVRRWPDDGRIVLGPPRRGSIALAARSQAIAISRVECDACEPLIARGLAAGATIAITAGGRPMRILRRGTPELEVAVELVEGGDDLGAGDVFAAALFVSLAGGAEPGAAGRLAAAAAQLRMLGEGVQAIAGRAAIESRLAGSATGPGQLARA